MPLVTTRDGISLHYEEAGAGTPILFLHEFAGDHRSWEAQLRYFSRSHRCIAYSARGFLPSEVPAADDAYTVARFTDDAIDVLDHLGIARAHVVGLSMGSYTALQIGLTCPERVLSLTLAGIGSGSDLNRLVEFRRSARDMAKQIEKLGMPAFAQATASAPNRKSFAVKDPRGFAEFNDAFSGHDATGAARVMRNFMGLRPPIFDFEADLQKLDLPTLIIVGDEDEGCIPPSLFLKRMIARSGMLMLPRTGHGVNLEEPDVFNSATERFLMQVESNR